MPDNLPDNEPADTADAPDYETAEGVGVVGGGVSTVEEADRLHHLATADPERDGTMTGPAHEAKYGLDRAEDSAARWRAAGVHPFENRRLRPGDEGYVDPAAAVGEDVEVVFGENNPNPSAAPADSADGKPAKAQHAAT